jgi:hypothetical protein
MGGGGGVQFEGWRADSRSMEESTRMEGQSVSWSEGEGEWEQGVQAVR